LYSTLRPSLGLIVNRNSDIIKEKKEKIMDIETAIEAIREEWDENGDVYTEEELREFALENLRDMLRDMD
jgi:hypothetical protein